MIHVGRTKRRLLILIPAVAVLITMGCGSPSQLTQTRSLLKISPQPEQEFVHDYDLYNAAIRTPSDRIVLLEKDVLESMDRIGVAPMASFLIHYLERLYFAKPDRWEEVTEKVLSKARKHLPLEKRPDEDRTIGVIDYSYPTKTQVFSLEAANLFFCLADSPLGRSFLESGDGAYNLLSLALILHQSAEELSRPVAMDDTAKQRLRLLFQQIEAACALGEESFGSGAGPSGMGLKDSFLACVLSVQDGSIVQAIHNLEMATRCFEAIRSDSTDPLASDGEDAEETEEEKKEREEREKELKDDLDDACEDDPDCKTAKQKSEAAAKFVDCSTSAEACSENAEEEATIQQLKLYYSNTKKGAEEAEVATEAGYKKKQYDAAVREHGHGSDQALQASAEWKDAATKHAKWVEKNKGKQLPSGGGVPPECIPEEISERREKIRAKITKEDLVSLRIEDPVDPWWITGCGALLFAMSDDMTQCMSGLVAPCAVVDPEPGSDFDYCDCADSVKSRQAAQAEVIEILSQPGNCAAIDCAEGFECVNGSCKPVVQESCQGEVPTAPGAPPDPPWINAYRGVSGLQPPSNRPCGLAGMYSVSYQTQRWLRKIGQVVKVDLRLLLEERPDEQATQFFR